MERLRDSWDGTKLSFEKDLAYGFSWPQRNYICSFCKKEFKSAQALGGHMNVHRRDRARLRDSSNPNPNPNPNLSAKVAAPILAEKKVSLFEYPKHDICGSGEEGGMNKGGMLEFTTRMETTVWKASEFLRLDLNVDLPNEELDLELRLGFSN